MFHLENNPPPFLTQNPNFQTEGVFDKEKYLQALANPQGNEWAPIESFMQETYIPNYKLQKMIDESIIITQEDIVNEYIKRNIKYTVTGAHVTEAKVSKDESKASIDELRVNMRVISRITRTMDYVPYHTYLGKKVLQKLIRS